MASGRVVGPLLDGVYLRDHGRSRSRLLVSVSLSCIALDFGFYLALS